MTHDNLWDELADIHPLHPNTDIDTPFIDWTQAFNRPPVDALVEGLLFPGRWTAIVAPAKVGKSTLALHLAHTIARGKGPFTNTPNPPVDVILYDGEMGELDVIERLTALELTPDDLTRLHYTDLVPKGDTVQGGAQIVTWAHQLTAGLVILDGMNAFVTGAEKDDTVWRALYENTIAPLKRAGIPVLTTDNTGHEHRDRARGSSVKLDKADGIVTITRTDNGIKLQTTHTRSSSYLREEYLTTTGLDGTDPIDYRETPRSWPAGTKTLAELLDTLGIPTQTGRDTARAILHDAGHKARNDVLSAAIAWRKTPAKPVPGTVPEKNGDRFTGQVPKNDF